MSIRDLSLWCITVGAVGVVAMTGATTTTAAVPEGYVLTWEDQFEGDALDETKWQHRDQGERRGAYNVPEAVSVQDGMLSIRTSYNEDEQRYETGMIGTRQTFQQKYGYFEARIRLQEQGGHWSAFWLQSPDIHTEVDPPDPATYGAEIDVMEYRHAHADMQHALHWNGYEDGHQTINEEFGFERSEDGWHTFGVHWTEDSYTFYVDGEETWHTTTAVSQRPQYMILSQEVPTPGTGEVGWAGGDLDEVRDAGGLPDGMDVDYVRAYIPEPGSLALLGAGGLVLLRRRRDR